MYTFLAELWQKWLTADAVQTVKKGGYYTQLIKPGLRLIAMNNNDCNIFNFWILYSVEEVAQKLQWLHDTLLMAEENDEKVHILAHIGSGEGSCFMYWGREYRRIIERFRDTVTAQFNGHSHYDEFNVYYEKNNVSNAVNVAWNGGSVTTYYNLNPNYVVYAVDGENYVRFFSGI
jgi:sphingomyelin phosphodiesterase